MSDTIASAPHRAVWPGTSTGPAASSRRHPETLRSIVATWGERIRFRWDLKQMSEDNPHLIDDIGLTRRQVEAEIAKRFWQA